MDIDDYSHQISNLLQNKSDKQRTGQNCFELAKMISAEMEQNKNALKAEESIKELKSDLFSQCFLNLEKSCKELTNKTSKLKSALENSNTLHMAKKQEIQNSFRKEVEELERKLQDVKAQLQEQCQKNVDTLALIQATSAVGLESTESNHKKHVADLAAKLRQSQNSYHKSKQELFDMKEGYNQRIGELQTEIQNVDVELQSAGNCGHAQASDIK